MPKTKKTPKSKLAAQVRRWLKSHDLQAVATRADVPLAWLRAFVKGHTRSPGVDRVEHIYTVITGKELAL